MIRAKNRPLLILLAGLMFVFNSACSSIPVEERAQKREDINQAAEETIEKLVEQGQKSILAGITGYGELERRQAKERQSGTRLFPDEV